MSRFSAWLPQRIYYLVSGLFFGAVVLRSLVIYADTAALVPVLAFLLLGFVLFLSEPAISTRWPHYFSFYLAIQSLLVFLLLALPDSPDYFATLQMVLSMQVMRRLDTKIGALWIGGSALVTLFLLIDNYGLTQALALVLIYTAGNAFVGSYTLAMSRAEKARWNNQELAQELHTANQQIQAYSLQLEQVAIARERNRLARELHDSVTQTVFSITLTTQSALLLLERDASKVREQLQRLNRLAASALAEMQVLISELKPEKRANDGLVMALQRHLASSRIPENLSISLQVEGDQALESTEEDSLFRIAEEALNNIIKHAHSSEAHIRLHLVEPVWMEIQDHGMGFDLRRAHNGAGIGLSSMSERAAEIGWSMQITTSPGAGTCIRVEKAAVREGQR